MNSIWIIERRFRERKNGKWSPWNAIFGTSYHAPRPTECETKTVYMETRAVEFIRAQEHQEVQA